MAWKVGDSLQGDKYQVEKILGQGSFGITYLVKDRQGDRALGIGSLTVATEPNYAPIEMYSNTIPLQAYTDVYSLAATLYNLLTGKLPETAQNRQANNQPLIPPKEHNGQISAQVNDAILWGMKLDPKERPESVNQWLKALGYRAINLPKLALTDPQIKLVELIIALLALSIGIWAGLPAWLDLMKSTPTPTSTNKSK